MCVMYIAYSDIKSVQCYVHHTHKQRKIHLSSRAIGIAGSLDVHNSAICRHTNTKL